MSPPKKSKGRSKVVDVAKNARLTQLRKERSRDAARSRRGKENTQFDELAKLLPLPNAITSQLDKASIVRLAISFLKMREFTGVVPQSKSEEIHLPNSDQVLPFMQGLKRRPPSLESFEQELGVHLLQALDGFLFAIDQNGKFLYVSETVSIHLGLSQVELTGSLIFSYIHPEDIDDIKKQLNFDYQPEEDIDEEGGLSRSFFLRMKCTLVRRGGSYSKSSGYKVVHCIGRLQHYSHELAEGEQKFALVVIGQPMPMPSINEIRLEYSAFVSRVNMDLKIVYCEGRIRKFTDYAARDIVGKSAFEFYHLGDVDKITEAHDQFLNKGQVVTKYYRWMGKRGGWNWLQTKCFLVCPQGQSDKRQMICINYVISGTEHQGVVLGLDQFQSCQQQKQARIVELDTDKDAEIDSSSNPSLFDCGDVDRKPNMFLPSTRPQNLQMSLNSVIDPSWPMPSEDSQTSFDIASILEANIPGFLSQISAPGNAATLTPGYTPFVDRLNRESFVSDDGSFCAEQEGIIENPDLTPPSNQRTGSISEDSCFGATPPDYQADVFNSNPTNVFNSNPTNVVVSSMQGYDMTTSYGEPSFASEMNGISYSSGNAGGPFNSSNTVDVNNQYIPPRETVVGPNMPDPYSMYAPASTQELQASDVIDLTSRSNNDIRFVSGELPVQEQYSWTGGPPSASMSSRRECSFLDYQQANNADTNVDVKPSLNMLTSCSQGIATSPSLPINIAQNKNEFMNTNMPWVTQVAPRLPQQLPTMPYSIINQVPQYMVSDQARACESQVAGRMPQAQMFRQTIQQVPPQMPSQMPGQTDLSLLQTNAYSITDALFYGNS